MRTVITWVCTRCHSGWQGSMLTGPCFRCGKTDKVEMRYPPVLVIALRENW